MSAKSKIILIVDDDQDILKLLTRILTTAGYKILSASTVEEAKTVLGVSAPHAVITDLHMSPESGFEFIQHIRTQKQYGKLPLIVLSALNDFTSVKKAIALGVNDYVIKPLQAPMLLLKVRKVLHNKDFAKWDVPSTEDAFIDVQVDVEVPSLGEAGCLLRAPFKITTGKDIKIKCYDFSSLGLEKLPMKSNLELKTYLPGGQFLNDITFVGISENDSAKIRQYISKRNLA